MLFFWILLLLLLWMASWCLAAYQVKPHLFFKLFKLFSNCSTTLCQTEPYLSPSDIWLSKLFVKLWGEWRGTATHQGNNECPGNIFYLHFQEKEQDIVVALASSLSLIWYFDETSYSMKLMTLTEWGWNFSFFISQQTCARPDTVLITESLISEKWQKFRLKRNLKQIFTYSFFRLVFP